jgi:cellulose synthase/poly-beta-1,6-N-acetylglucosamine synthase-like glycosyltransferase
MFLMPALPYVTVIVPAHNEERYIKSTVRSIQAQRFPAESIEILVIDNNSVDRTADVARSSGARVILCPDGKVGAVRNLGVTRSKGDILAFIDGDCEAGATWLGAAVTQLADPAIGAVGGSCLLPAKTTWVERAFAGRAQGSDGEVQRLAGSSFIIRRTDFESIGKFSETLSAGEDDELSARVRQNGLKLVALTECSVIHNGYPKSLGQLFVKQLWHGRNQLEAAETWRDPTLVLTHIFAVLVIGAVVSAIPGNVQSTALSVMFATGVFASALLLAAVKSRRTGGGMARVVPLTAINLVYLLARAFALAGNYWRRLVRSPE